MSSDYANQHNVTALPAFLSVGGFTQEAKAFCAENSIGVAQEINSYGTK